jgi:hypothetical protein
LRASLSDFSTFFLSMTLDDVISSFLLEVNESPTDAIIFPFYTRVRCCIVEMVFSELIIGILGWKFKAFPFTSFLAKGFVSLVGIPADEWIAE